MDMSVAKLFGSRDDVVEGRASSSFAAANPASAEILTSTYGTLGAYRKTEEDIEAFEKSKKLTEFERSMMVGRLLKDLVQSAAAIRQEAREWDARLYTGMTGMIAPCCGEAHQGDDFPLLHSLTPL